MSYDKKSTYSLDFGSMQPSTNYQNQFQKALILQQEKKFDEALSLYQSLLNQNLSKNPDLSPSQLSDISYNMALTYFSKQDYAQSYIYNQKAILLNPFNSLAHQFSEKITSHFQLKVVGHDITITENLNKLGLAHVPIEALWVFCTIFLSLFVRSFINHFVNRKNQLLTGSKVTLFKLKNYIWLILFLFFAAILLIKISDVETPKGFIKTDSATLKTAAGENQASLTDLPIGSLVYILRVIEIDKINYFQVKYPGGVSGWIKQEEIETVSLPKD